MGDNSSSFPLFMVNQTLKVAVMFTTMESLFTARLPNGSLANIYGSSNVAYGFLLDLQEIFQFRIKIIPSVGWITEGENGALTGVGAQVHFGQADIGLDLSKPVVYRAKHLTFLHAIKQDRVAIMFRQPEVQMYRNILVRPFKEGLWKRVLQAFFAIFLSTLVITRKRGIQNIVLPITGAMLGRSVNMKSILNNQSKSLHIVLFVTSLFGLTMYSIYSAFIVSSLRRQVSPVKKFQDLIDFDYELLAQKSLPDFTNVYLRNPKEGSKYAKIAKKNFVNEQVSLRKLFHPDDDNATVSDDIHDEDNSGAGVAWFVLKSDFYYLALQNNYTTKEICDVSKLEPTSRAEHPRLLAMYIAKKSKKGTTTTSSVNDYHNDMKEYFNRRILDILARGLGRRHVMRYESEFQPNCAMKRRVQVLQIRYFDVYAAYWILSCGAGFSLGVLVICEILFPHLLRAMEKNLMCSNRKYQMDDGRPVHMRYNGSQFEIPGEKNVGMEVLW